MDLEVREKGIPIGILAEVTFDGDSVWGIWRGEFPFDDAQDQVRPLDLYDGNKLILKGAWLNGGSKSIPILTGVRA